MITISWYEQNFYNDEYEPQRTAEISVPSAKAAEVYLAARVRQIIAGLDDGDLLYLYLGGAKSVFPPLPEWHLTESK